MCEKCCHEKHAQPSRRGLLKFFGAASVGLALGGAGNAKEAREATKAAKCRLSRCFA